MTLHLPEEILQLIFSFLEPRPRASYWHGCYPDIALLHRTLAAVCRLNRTCHRLATPFLYSTVQIYSQPRYLDTGLEVSGLEPNSAVLLESLLGRECEKNDREPPDLSRPPIGRSVKHICIEWVELLPPDATDKCKTDMETFLEEGGERPYLGETWLPENVAGMPEDRHQELDWQVFDAAQAAKLRDEVVWHLGDAYATGVEDAEVATILMLCRDGIESLDLTAVPSMRHSLIMDVVEELWDSHQRSEDRKHKPPFYKLSQLSVRGERAPLGNALYHFGDLGPFLRLPSLKTLRAHGMQCIIKHNPSRHYPGLSRIEIDQGVLNADGLEDILSSCPNLKELTFSVNGPNEDEMDLEELGERLQEHGRALTKLILNTNDSGSPSLSALDKLVDLRHFGASHTGLLGPVPERNVVEDHISEAWQDRELSKLLPPSLEVLEFLEDENFDSDWHWAREDSQVMKLLGDTQFSKLKEIRLHARQRDSFTCEEHLEPMGWTKGVEDGVVVLRKTCDGGRDRCDSALELKEQERKASLDTAAPASKPNDQAAA